MSISQIFKTSFTFIFKNYFWILLIGVALSLPILLAQEWLQTFLAASTSRKPESVQHVIMVVASIIAFFILVLSLCQILPGTIAVRLGGSYFGKEVSWWEALKLSFKRFFHLALLTIMLCLLALSPVLLITPVMFISDIVFALAILPAFFAMFFIATALALSIPALMLENLRPIQALKRSFHLTKKSRLRVLGYFLLMALIMFIIFFPAGFITSSANNPIVDLIVNTIVIPFATLWPAVSTLLFIDLRNKKEQEMVVADRI